MRKLFIIILALAIGGLFINGLFSFKKKYLSRKYIQINNNEPAPESENYAEKTKSVFSKSTNMKLLQSIGYAMNNPITETIKTISKKENDQNTDQDKKITGSQDDPIKRGLENYFLKSSRVTFPETKLVSQSITLHKQGSPDGLITIIELLKNANKELYGITPPLEAEKIHKNSLWVGEKFIEVLEQVSKENDEQKIINLLSNDTVKEIKNITDETIKEINSLIEKYGLEINI